MYNLFKTWQAHTANNDYPATSTFVFDCDQTLINGDIGEATLRQAIAQRWIVSHEAWWQHLKSADFPHDQIRQWRKHYERESTQGTVEPSQSLSEELWFAYTTLCEQDVQSAYIFAARLGYGRSVLELRTLTENVFQSDVAVGDRSLMKHFINDLNSLGQVWVLSSSHIDIVRVIARRYSIPDDHVIGINFKRSSAEVYTDHLMTPAPIGAKKVDSFRVYNHTQPMLMAGDSRHDLPMMNYAQSALFIDHHQSIDLTQEAQALNALIICCEDLID